MILPDLVLRSSGAIRGKIRLPEDEDTTTAYMLAYGIDRFTKTDKNGVFLMSNLAEGTYTLRLISGSDVYRPSDTASIEVHSAETTTIETITLQYRDTFVPHDLTLVYDTLTQRVTVKWNMVGSTPVDSFYLLRKDTIPDTAFGPDTFRVDHSVRTITDSTCIQDHKYDYCVKALYPDSSNNRISRVKRVTISSHLTVNSRYTVPGTGDLSGFDVAQSGDLYRYNSADSSILVLDSLERETKRFSLGFKIDGLIRVSDDRLFIRRRDENTRRYDVLSYSIEDSLLDTLVSQTDTMVWDVKYNLLATAGFPDSLGNGDSVTVMSLDDTVRHSWRYGQGGTCRGICVADTNRIFLASAPDLGTPLKIVEYNRSGTILSEKNLPDITMFNMMAFDRKRQLLFISCHDRDTLMTNSGVPDMKLRMIGMVNVYDAKFNVVAVYRVMNGTALSTMVLRADGSLYLGVTGTGTASDQLIRFNPVAR
jgi:hypothetical protein